MLSPYPQSIAVAALPTRLSNIVPLRANAIVERNVRIAHIIVDIIEVGKSSVTTF